MDLSLDDLIKVSKTDQKKKPKAKAKAKPKAKRAGVRQQVASPACIHLTLSFVAQTKAASKGKGGQTAAQKRVSDQLLWMCFLVAGE